MTKTETEPDWGTVWRELAGGGDRAAVILGQAILEESLRGLLASRLVDGPVAVRVLEPASRPLNLKRAADLAYCVGLITERELEELRAIADIRNHFAHCIHGARFSDAAVAKHVERLLAFKRFLNSKDDSVQRLFGAAVTVLFYNFGNRAMGTLRLDPLMPSQWDELMGQIGRLDTRPCGLTSAST